MSSLWTPGGERPVPRQPRPDPGPGGSGGFPGGFSGGGDDAGAGGGELTEAEMKAEMEALREQLATTPASVVVANHAYGLFELAALHLSLNPPQLEEARLAIDSLGYLVEGLGERLGEPAAELEAALAQLRMAYVQMHASLGPQGGSDAGREGDAPPAGDGPAAE